MEQEVEASRSKDAYEAGFDMETFDKVALDRAKWRKLVAAQWVILTMEPDYSVFLRDMHHLSYYNVE